MKLLTLHQRLCDIVKEADPDEKLSWADLVNIANHLVEAGVTLDDTDELPACDCGCDDGGGIMANATDEEWRGFSSCD